jgi:hypothetical protein
MTHNPVSGKRSRKLRIRANHAQLHARYTTYVREHGAGLSYDQWLHPQMSRKAALDELVAQSEAMGGYAT